MTNYVVKAHVLKTDLFHRFLEIRIVQHFKSVSVDEKHGVSLDLSMARLYQAFISRLLSSLVSIEPQVLDPLHLIFPFLRDNLEETLWGNVI